MKSTPMPRSYIFLLFGLTLLLAASFAPLFPTQAQNIPGPNAPLYTMEGSSSRSSCFVEAVTATTQCFAAAPAGSRWFVTGAVMSNEAATVQTLDIVFGTGSNCGTNTTALTHKFQFGTVATTTSPFVMSAVFNTPLIPTGANALATAICVRPSQATAFGATLTGYLVPAQ